MKSVPEDFPHFEFADHAEQADLLTHYLWYHFHHRLGNGLTLFNQEYLLTSDIWQRFLAILDWEKEVHAGGGYRKYYEGGKRDTTLQGGGTAGGLGIDCEFYESGLVPSIVVYGFLGLEADPAGMLRIRPRLPESCPKMGLRNFLYHNVRMDVAASDKRIDIVLKDSPIDPLQIALDGKWREETVTAADGVFFLAKAGAYRFSRDR